jgi:photosystem II stability/assembly factor-like uncharacterized protein
MRCPRLSYAGALTRRAESCPLAPARGARAAGAGRTGRATLVLVALAGVLACLPTDLLTGLLTGRLDSRARAADVSRFSTPKPPREKSAGIDPALLAGLKARSIGPAGMSGRVADIQAVESNRDIIYVGASTGGVWKSANAGLTWQPIFDDQPVAAIGAIGIFQPSPDLVWVGTGEGNPRNSASVGDGIYKSLDGGREWQHVGLDPTERIARIVTHPTNPDVVYVAAMGKEWGENEERGVFKTQDGGKTWTKVLYVDERTGCADLAMDPSNPEKLIASMWDYRRWPWFFRSGGPGSGLFVTYDGGDHWKRMTEEDGLPKGDVGRIGVAFCRKHPETVYAIVEAEKSALLRSNDGGKSWRTVNSETNVSGRPFYYSDLRVDPERPDRVYQLSTMARVSDDGGKTFRILIGWNALHPDHHAMWIDPNDPTFIIDGNDGGAGVSYDRGETWRFVGNLPLAQLYHIAFDNETPYNVYGGMQDNGSWRGPSSVWENGGIRTQHWEEVGFGDGFDTRPDPQDSHSGYSMSQEGYLMRWNLRTGERKSVRPPAPNDSTELRFNWNTGLAIDPFDPKTIYYGSQFLHKSTDRGDSWTIISPDLTSNNREWQKQKESGGLTPDVSGAENFTTIIAIAPSPLQRGMIWVGTDDGRVHVTRDGGANWTSVEGNAKGVPKNTWVPHITASRFDPAVAFVVFDDHRRSNWTPYVFRASDYGEHWESLVTKDIRGYALCIEQDPVDADLLFLGTEFGLYVSVDGGVSWMRFKHGVPTVSVMCLAIQPRDHDLLIGTHGRAAFVLDDIRPLRKLTAQVMDEPLHLFDIAPAQQYSVKQTGGSRFPGAGEFRGDNRPYGALITWSMSGEDLPHPDDKVERERKEAKRAKEREERKKGEGVKRADEVAPAAALRAERPTKLSRKAAGEAGKEATEKGKPQAGQEAAGEQETPGAGGAAGAGGATGEGEKKGKDEGPKVEIRITDALGKLVRKLEAPAKLGVNRAVWDLSSEPFKQPPRENRPFDEPNVGPEVVPGTYNVTVKFKGHEAKGSVQVLADPRMTIAANDRQANWDAQQRAGHLQEVVTEALQRIKDTRADADVVIKKVNAILDDEKQKKEKEGVDTSAAAGDSTKDAADPRKALVKRANELKKKLTELEKQFWIPPDTKGIPYENDQALSRIGLAQMFLSSSWEAPSPSALAYLGRAERDVQKVLVDFNRFFADDVAAFRKDVDVQQLRLLPSKEPLTIGSGK